MLTLIIFELKRALRRPAVYIYWALFFLVGFAFMNLAGGAFSSVRFAMSGDNTYVNAPGIFGFLFGTFSYLGVIIVAAVTAPIAFRDFRNQTHEMVFSTPMKKSSYVFGGFLAAFIIVLFINTGTGVGLYMGTLMPYLNRDLFGPFIWSAYTNPYLSTVLPNAFFLTAIFYGLTLLKRNVMVNWLTIAAIYLLYALGQRLLSILDYQTLAALLDPFGLASSLVVSIGSSAEELNRKALSMEGVFLYNRMLWTFLGVIILISTYHFFNLSTEGNSKPYRGKGKNSQSGTVSPRVDQPESHRPFPKMNISFNLKNHLNALLAHLKINMSWLYGNMYFWLLTLMAIVFMAVSSRLTGKVYDTVTYPVTYQMLNILSGTLKLFIYLFIALFSGELIFRDQAHRMHELAGTQPGMGSVKLWTKLITIVSGVVLMLLFLMACGISAQAIRGYYLFEVPLYLKYIFLLELPPYILFAFLAFFIHVLFNNKYAGLVGILAFYLVKTYLLTPLVGHNLLIYAAHPSVIYSDMNGFGYNLAATGYFYIYWFLFAALLFLTSIAIYNDGTEQGILPRLHRMGSKVNRRFNAWFTILIMLFVGYAGWMTWQTSIRNEFLWPSRQQKQVIAYEEKYKKYENIEQPRIVEVYYDADLRPEEKSLFVNGHYWLRNQEESPLSDIHVNYTKTVEELAFSNPYRTRLKDPDLGYYIYSLKEPLQPGDSVRMDFRMVSRPKGFSNSGYRTLVQPNGTMFYNSIFPSVGYNRRREMTNHADRRQQGLPKREQERSLDYENARNQNFISQNADFIRYEAIIRTAPDQTAVTPGKRINAYMEDGRQVFHYKSERPMVNYFAVLSATLEEESRTWYPADSSLDPVTLSVLYHPKHHYNVPMMLEAMKESLTSYSNWYSPYQYSQLRVVEFPRYAAFAQSLPNMIPYSEGIGFISDLRNAGDPTIDARDRNINYPYWFIAHEVAHQWWAHQMIAADAEGAQFLMESVTQYAALKQMRKKYGPHLIKKVLREEMFTYINGRKHLQEEEQPLIKVPAAQQSVYYQKGAYQLLALHNELGDHIMTRTLQQMLKQFAYSAAPYPLSTDFLEILKSHAPDSLHGLIDDKLTKICFYEFDIVKAQYKRTPALEYFVDVELRTAKFYADGNGKETRVPFNDIIPVGFYSDNDELVAMKYIHVNGDSDNLLSFKLDRRPAKVVVDPEYQRLTKDFNRPEVTVEIL